MYCGATALKRLTGNPFANLKIERYFMKKKILIALVTLCAALTACLAFAGCSEDPVELVGMYKYYEVSNHNTAKDPARAYSQEYRLDLYSDNTYVMTHQAFWGMANGPDMVCGREMVYFGTYTTVSESSVDGSAVYNLEKPTRIILFHQERSEVANSVDTDNWPQVTEDSDGYFRYQVSQRAGTEEWATAEDFIEAYYRTYTVTCDTASKSMEVKVTSHNGVEIDGYSQVNSDGSLVKV